jgi:hypothetical protein
MIAASAAFIIIGLLAIANLGIRELYADQWREYKKLLELPFPINVLTQDNGHRLVFPSLLRLVELRIFDGNQLVQLASGALFALATWVVIVTTVLRDPSVRENNRWSILALGGFALFWLANARMLLHGNEAVNVYLVVLAVVSGLALISSPQGSTKRVALASLAGLIASLSFGPGIAAFVGFGVVLLLKRHRAGILIVLSSLVIALVLQFALPGGQVLPQAVNLRPLDNANTAATWLSSMWFHLLGPFVQTTVGDVLPLGLDALGDRTAAAYASRLGNPKENEWPFTILGWGGIFCLALSTLSAWRTSALGTSKLMGLGIAWFALGDAALTSLSRLDYFSQHSGQIFANRYLPWSCLFWFGLATSFCSQSVSKEAEVTRKSSARPVAALALVLVLVVGLITSQEYLLWSKTVQERVSVASAGVVSGVVEFQDFPGFFPEVQSGLPTIRAARISEFAWPESDLMGRLIEPGRAKEAKVLSQEVKVFHNLLGGEATKLGLTFGPSTAHPPARLLVVAGQRVVGVAVRRLRGTAITYTGYANGPYSSFDLSLVELRSDGSTSCWFGCRKRRN